MVTMTLAQLGGYLSKKKKMMLQIAPEAYIILANRVVKSTPVDTGNLRRKWTPSIGRPAVGGGVSRIAAVARAAAPGSTFFLSNGELYARPIEYEAHSPQAPRGMVRINVADWPRIVKRATNRVNKR